MCGVLHHCSYTGVNASCLGFFLTKAVHRSDAGRSARRQVWGERTGLVRPGDSHSEPAHPRGATRSQLSELPTHPPCSRAAAFDGRQPKTGVLWTKRGTTL